MDRAAQRITQLTSSIEERRALLSTLDPASGAYATLAAAIQQTATELAAWYVDRQRMLAADSAVRAAHAELRRVSQADSPWPRTAGLASGIGGVFGAGWLAVDVPAMGAVAAVCAAAAAVAVWLTIRDRSRAPARRDDALAALDAALAAYQRTIAAITDPQRAQPTPAAV